ncbi:MAG: DUF2306 domain-containing protein [Crocinitomicaceae bacterium]|jgi:hypothetical protein|nr:DUF2306 domain-containing protein [Crocinitomicaceae bacterium]
MNKLITYTGWLIVVFFASCLIIIALSYFSFNLNFHFLRSKQDLLSNTIWLASFYLHLLFGVVAILSGIPLFFNRLIPFKSNLHQILGRVYILSILLITGPTGFYLSFFAEGGIYATIGFLCMTMAWMVPTYLAFVFAVKKKIEAHYLWMIRSLALTLSGVTLRLLTPFGSHILELDEDSNFILTAYLSWMINWGIAEIIILRVRNRLKNSNFLME